MGNHLRVLLGSAAIGLAWAATASAASAQAVSPPPSKDRPVPGTVEELIVTARRVMESAQDVPIPTSVISGNDLNRARIFTPEALTGQIPNVKVFKGAGNSNTYAFYIRGIGRDIGYMYAEAPVSLYIDDVFYPYQGGPVLDIGGIDRAEVLRGPQGTLYGKNATVGTVKIYNKRPNLNAEDRSAAITFGSYGRFETQFSENMPLIDGKLAIRADFGSKYYDGFLHDLVTHDTVGGINRYGGRFGLLWAPDDKNELYVSLDGETSRDEKVPWTSAVNTGGVVTNRYGDRFTVASSMPNVNKLDVGGATVQGKTEFAGVTLRSITAFRGFHQDFTNDNTSRLDLPLAWNEIRTHDNYWTQEFVASGELINNRLNWVGGLFYFDDTASLRFITAPGATQWTKQHSKSEAAYIDGSFNVTDALRITAGVRYSHDEKDAHQVSANAAGAKIVDVPVQASWNATTPKVGIDYKVNPNILVFATWGKGYKGGGLSTGQPTVPGQVLFIPPENATSTEIGIKSEWFDHRLRVNVNYFDTDYKNLIQTILNTSTGVSSVAFSDAKDKGFEAEVVAKPTAHWTLRLIGTQLDADYVNVHAGFPAFTFVDKALKHAPRHAFTVGTDYVLDAFGGSLTLGGDYEWYGKMFESLARDPITTQGPYGLVNLRAIYDFPGDHYQIVVDGTNVRDSHYFKLGSTGLARQYGPPPEVSVTFRYKM
jgi:iron complex outermembrane receptor protein